MRYFVLSLLLIFPLYASAGFDLDAAAGVTVENVYLKSTQEEGTKVLCLGAVDPVVDVRVDDRTGQVKAVIKCHDTLYRAIKNTFD